MTDHTRDRVRQLEDQLHRIIRNNAERDARLRGHTPWHPMIDSDRLNCLAWREAPGGRELLMYNNALCDPIWIAFQPQNDPECDVQVSKE